KKVLSLSSRRKKRSLRLGAHRNVSHPCQLFASVHFPEFEGGQFRTMGLQPLRQAPLRNFLQKLYRESLGYSLFFYYRCLGREADTCYFYHDCSQQCTY